MDLTAFIGKNGVGKSTIFEALEIFFNNSLIVCEREDLSLSVGAGNQSNEITCIFNESAISITLDISSETNLNHEFILN